MWLWGGVCVVLLFASLAITVVSEENRHDIFWGVSSFFLDGPVVASGIVFNWVFTALDWNVESVFRHVSDKVLILALVSAQWMGVWLWGTLSIRKKGRLPWLGLAALFLGSWVGAGICLLHALYGWFR